MTYQYPRDGHNAAAEGVVTPIVVDGPTLKGDISWSKDVRQDLPANVQSYNDEDFFSNKEYLIDADNKIPYDVVEIFRAKASPSISAQAARSFCIWSASLVCVFWQG